MKKQGSANATINRKLAALSKVLNFAHSRQWIDGVPKIERMREPQGRIRWFTKEEEEQITSWFTRTGYEEMSHIVVFLIDSGIRLGELSKLRWNDVKDGVTHVRESKSGKPRSIPQTGRIKGLVPHLRGTAPLDQEHVFSTPYAMIGKRWNQCREALNKTDDPEWVIHTLRHTFVSRLVQKGHNLRVVQELAGHSSLLITQRYAHLSPANLVSAISSLDLVE